MLQEHQEAGWDPCVRGPENAWWQRVKDSLIINASGRHPCTDTAAYNLSGVPRVWNHLSPRGNAILNERTMKFRGSSARERDFLPNFQDAPRESAILKQRTMKSRGCSARERNFVQRMLRAGARVYSKFSGCSARERDFSSKFPGCSARERDFPNSFQDAPRGSAIFFQIFRMPCAGARF